MNARPGRGFDLFAAAGLTRARFSRGEHVGWRRRLRATTCRTRHATRCRWARSFRRPVGAGSQCFGRADVVFSGAYHYDEANLEGQVAYSLVNIRAGVKARGFVAEAWVKNAFDTRYIPRRIRIRGPRAVRLPRRERPSSDVWRQRRIRVL